MVGANCGTTLENMQKILIEYREAAPQIPLWVKPNAGLPRLTDGKTIYDVTPAQMAEFAQGAVQLGGRVIGGCCGSTPQHIAAIAAALKK